MGNGTAAADVVQINAGTTFGTKGPFQVDIHEAVKTAEGWRESKNGVVAVVTVDRAFGIMHVSARALPAAVKALPGRTLYCGDVREVA